MMRPARGLYFFLFSLLFTCSTFAGKIALVSPNTENLSGDARFFAISSERRLKRWLEELGIAATPITQSALNNQSLKGVSVLILPYNPDLNAAEVQAISRHFDRGGKALVFQNSNNTLAGLMSVTLGKKVTSSRSGTYSTIKLHNRYSSLIPEALIQHSWHLVPAFPKTGSTIFASWLNDHGNKRPEPAILSTPHGYWFSQLLLDGDNTAKKKLLLSLIGKYDPMVWKNVATTLRHSATTIEPYPNFKSTLLGISPRYNHEPNAAKRSALLANVNRMVTQTAREIRNYEYQQAVEHLFTLEHQLQTANALAQKPQRGEFRGVWDHDGTGIIPGDWNYTARVLQQHGFNAVFPNLLWTGKAHLRSNLTPPSKTAQQYGDQLEAALRACNPRGIDVHLWKVCWRLSNAPASLLDDMKRQGRLQVNSKGQTIPWLCPSNPANRAMEIRSLVEVAQHYQLQGIHLDYIRYPDRDSSFSPHARKAFERYLGKKVSDWPKAAHRGGRLSGAFQKFRAGEITQFIRELRRELKAIRPDIQLSAAVFGKYPACIDSVGQDYAQWLKEGLVDFLVPMNYTDEPANYSEWLRVQNNMPSAYGKIYPGIGAVSNESELRPDQITHQINIGRKKGNKGFVLFRLDRSLEERILPFLSIGSTRPQE